MKKLSFVAPLFFILAFYSPITSHAEPSGPDNVEQSERAQNLTFQTLDIGTRSGCTRPAKMLITDEKEWARVWQMHTQPEEMKFSIPSVDFSRQAVVALLMGNQPGYSSATVVQIIKGKVDTTVYYEELPGQKGAPTTTQAFHFAVIDKPVNAIRFANVNEECAVCVVR